MESSENSHKINLVALHFGMTRGRDSVTDVDACGIAKCGSNTYCIDKPPPAIGTAKGRTCYCEVGYDGSNPDLGCTGEC